MPGEREWRGWMTKKVNTKHKLPGIKYHSHRDVAHSTGSMSTISLLLWLMATGHPVVENLHCHDNYPTNTGKDRLLMKSTCLIPFWLMSNEGDNTDFVGISPWKKLCFSKGVAFLTCILWVESFKKKCFWDGSTLASFVVLVCNLFIGPGGYCWVPSFHYIFSETKHWVITSTHLLDVIHLQ